MTSASAFASATASADAPVLAGPLDDRAVTDLVCAPLLRPAGRGWWIAFAVCTLGLIATLVGVYELFTAGVGIWGINTSVVWGTPSRTTSGGSASATPAH